MKRVLAVLLACFTIMSCNNQKQVPVAADGSWREITPEEVSLNPVKMVGDDWLELSAGKEGDLNLMTIGWGTFGVLWNKPVYIVYVSPARYTYEFMERNEYFTVTHFPEAMQEKLGYLGSVSGRDEDKVAGAGLTVEFTELGNPIYAEADLAIECRKIYSVPFDPALLPEEQRDWYASRGLPIHHMYIGEILHIWEK
ncbi:MAG: flavin reductase family protein [Bacteroidales bacterium]|nr:flavin reductase family protein [Bacteroidales bacterium]